MSFEQITPLATGGNGGLQSYSPEPSTTGIGIFRDVLQTTEKIGEGVLRTAQNLGSFGSFEELLGQQIQAQQEMQQVSLVSNIERSKHETKMAAIRNIRLS